MGSRLDQLRVFIDSQGHPEFLLASPGKTCPNEVKSPVNPQPSSNEAGISGRDISWARELVSATRRFEWLTAG